MTGVVNGSKCFVAGTLVLTEDGEKPIEDIEVGDYVYSTDPETGESGFKEVLNVFIRQSNIIIHVFVNGEEIEATPTHPFWVENEWVTADKLTVGDVLTLADGTTCAIDRVYAEFSDKAITVYNFEVADFHSYYVTDTGVLVHNAPSDYIIKHNASEESKRKWGKGTFDSVDESLDYHFDEHGSEVGAKDVDEYVRKADGFKQNLRGARKGYPSRGTPGAVRYTKNGKYIIIGSDGKILSFGLKR